MSAGEPVSLTVLPKTIDGGPPGDMMKRHLLKEVQVACGAWRKRYEQLKTPQQVAAYQTRLKTSFAKQLGALPKRTDLNARIAGKVQRSGFSVEKIIFESQPRHYVTALLFLPDRKLHKPPYPGVIVPCGHSALGKGYDMYQRAGALLALNGIAALVFDPIDQGERGQLLDSKGRPPMWGTKAHTMLGVGSILLGRNTAWFEVWDGMRAIDYLQSRPEVDPKRIGCTGNSGGGTQTSYLMALDDRISCAAPGCYLTSFERLLQTIGPGDAEQNVFGQIAFGMLEADYILIRAPKPTLICCASRDFFDIDGTWGTFRYAKRLYTRLGYSQRVDLAETDNTHGFHMQLRVAMVRWMMRWLDGRNKPITEPDDLKVLTKTEFLCTPKGQVMAIDGARSVYDINDDRAAVLAKERRELWAPKRRAETLKRAARLAGIRRLNKLPIPVVTRAGVIKRGNCSIEKLIIKPEAGVYLPALLLTPNKKTGSKPVVYLHEGGKTANAGRAINELVAGGRVVLAADLRGIGETAQKRQRKFASHFGADWQDFFTAYLLGRSFVGMRAEDVLTCARWLAKREKTASVDMIAVGHVGVPALHAATIEPDQFASVKLSGVLSSWSDVVRKRIVKRQLINVVHGALEVYDLPDLARSLGKKLTIADPASADGK
ncbi:MAG: acetylxylan esterase [Phycisphaerae bacterium]|nr:acetylxylan esterase [Phycisphaerae bacterium]